MLLIIAYGLGMLYSLKTHREQLPRKAHRGGQRLALGLALATLAGVTVLVAIVSEILSTGTVGGEAFGMTPAFVGFIIVAGRCASTMPAFSAR